MPKFHHQLLAGLFAAVSFAVQAQVPSHIGRAESSQKDHEAILQVTRDFQATLIDKDGDKLSSLLLNPKILFSSPASPAGVRKRRGEGDANFDGVDPAGAAGFVEFIASSKVRIEERFYNIRITQDRHLAWVIFDFEFLEAGKVENHGVETWQMLKTADESWKILSVVWSSHGAPK